MEVVVGKITRAHGIHGDVVVDVRTDEPDRRFVVGSSFDTDQGTLTVAEVRWHSSRLLITFEDVSTRTAAEDLRGLMLVIDVPADEHPDDPAEYYDHQLVGLAAYTEAGAPLGEVAEVLHLPGQDLLAIRDLNGTEHLVPFVTELVPNVDLGAGRVSVVERPGLLDSADGS